MAQTFLSVRDLMLITTYFAQTKMSMPLRFFTAFYQILFALFIATIYAKASVQQTPIHANF